MSTGETAPTKLAMLAGTISTPGIRDFTIEMLKVAPASFRTARASRNNHPLDERESGGNALHTLRVAKLVRLMVDACNLNSLLADIVTSAAAIHDLGRYGLNDTDEYTSKEHALVPRKIAEKHSITCDYAEVIFKVAEDHMGRWGPNQRIPKVSLSDILHFSDAISAHADEVWEQLGGTGTSWIGGIPFSEQGMTQDMMFLFAKLAENDEYWKTALSFVRSVSSRKWSSLTEKQQDWIGKICDSLAKEAFESGNESEHEIEPEDIPF